MRTEKTTAQILREARELIADEENWAQGWYAYDEGGERLNPDKPAAKRCAAGAVCYVEGVPPSRSTALGLLGAVIKDDENWCKARVFIFNDTHSHAEVLELFDRAIELAEREAETPHA